MDLAPVRGPTAFLRDRLGEFPPTEVLEAYEASWAEHEATSRSVDAAGTPWLRMFDALGTRVDEILLPPAYWAMLGRGYRAGHLWRPFESESLVPFYLLGYVTAFHDPGLLCPYTVSLSTAVPLEKYGTPDLKGRFLPRLLDRDDPWQGATWMTEASGGSDLGAAVETVAEPAGKAWRLTGDKHFASNVGAELAVVAARPRDGPEGVRGLALFLVPHRREDGSRNYWIRRLKDKVATRSVPTGEVELRESEGFLLGRQEDGIYTILEVLNLSRVANAVGSVALAQRAMADALAFAEARVAFGKPVVEHPLLRGQFEERWAALRSAFALAWEAVLLLDEVWRETPPYSDRHGLFRLVAHLAKYWTAEFAAQMAKWGMEVHGGGGVLAEYPAERWLREAMVLAIWEGTPHRQILDGMEAMERKGAHGPLFDALEGEGVEEAAAMRRRVEDHLDLPRDAREARSEDLFADLARFVGDALAATGAGTL